MRYTLKLSSFLEENEVEKETIHLSDEGEYRLLDLNGIVQTGKFNKKFIKNRNSSQNINEKMFVNYIMNITSEAGYTDYRFTFSRSSRQISNEMICTTYIIPGLSWLDINIIIKDNNMLEFQFPDLRHPEIVKDLMCVFRSQKIKCHEFNHDGSLTKGIHFDSVCIDEFINLAEGKQSSLINTDEFKLPTMKICHGIAEAIQYTLQNIIQKQSEAYEMQPFCLYRDIRSLAAAFSKYNPQDLYEDLYGLITEDLVYFNNFRKGRVGQEASTYVKKESETYDRGRDLFLFPRRRLTDFEEKTDTIYYNVPKFHELTVFMTQKTLQFRFEGAGFLSDKQPFGPIINACNTMEIQWKYVSSHWRDEYPHDQNLSNVYFESLKIDDIDTSETVIGDPKINRMFKACQAIAMAINSKKNSPSLFNCVYIAFSPNDLYNIIAKDVLKFKERHRIEVIPYEEKNENDNEIKIADICIEGQNEAIEKKWAISSDYPKNALFSNNIGLFKELLQLIIHDNLDEAEEILKIHPEFLLKRGTATHEYIHGGGKQIVEDVTPLQLTIGSRNLAIAAMMQSYFERLPNGLAEAANQIEEFDANFLEEKPYDFTDLINALNAPVRLDTGFDVLRKCIKKNPHLDKVLEKFREDQKTRCYHIKNGMDHFNMGTLLKAYELIEKLSADYRNSFSCKIVWVEVIRYLQGLLPSYVAQRLLCQSLGFIKQSDTKFKRIFDIVIGQAGEIVPPSQRELRRPKRFGVTNIHDLLNVSRKSRFGFNDDDCAIYNDSYVKAPYYTGGGFLDLRVHAQGSFSRDTTTYINQENEKWDKLKNEYRALGLHQKTIPETKLA